MGLGVVHLTYRRIPNNSCRYYPVQEIWLNNVFPTLKVSVVALSKSTV